MSESQLDRRPLFGKRVLVTRAREQASAAAELLRERGAEPVVVPTIELHPPRDPEAVLRAIARMSDGQYAWVVFTSANGVHRAREAAGASGKDAGAFGACRLAAIGPATAQALQEHGLRADVVARELTGEGLAEEMLRVLRTSATSAAAISGVKVLVLRAEEAREVLPEALRAAGCTVDVVGVYETRSIPDAAERLREAVLHGRLDAVTFTSSSTVDSLCDALGEGAASMLEPLRVVSIGPITTATAIKRGLRVDATATQSTLPGLVDALAASFDRQP
jgi:uroporphyrinogen III methyltransferase/synthase